MRRELRCLRGPFGSASRRSFVPRSAASNFSGVLPTITFVNGEPELSIV